MSESERDAVLADLRDGKLRQIGPRIKGLNAARRRAVSDEVCRGLERALRRGALDHTHRWLVTALQFLAPAEAGELVTRALGESIHLVDCCGCVRNRLMRAAGASATTRTMISRKSRQTRHYVAASSRHRARRKSRLSAQA